MSAKAVFQSQALAIYITGADLDLLAKQGDLDVHMYVGKRMVRSANVLVDLGQVAWDSLRKLIVDERAAIDADSAAMKAEAAKHKRPGAVQEDLTDGR